MIIEMVICLDSPGNGEIRPGRCYTGRLENGRRRRTGCVLCLVNALLGGADLVKRG
jgi:hypothetical protein